jgi:hypothetical protein
VSEAIYDAEIEPKLLEVAKLCEQRGLPFVAAVQYEPGAYGETRYLPEHTDLAMVMNTLMIGAQGNADLFVIEMRRYCAKHGIDTGASIVLSDFGKCHSGGRDHG